MCLTHFISTKQKAYRKVKLINKCLKQASVFIKNVYRNVQHNTIAAIGHEFAAFTLFPKLPLTLSHSLCRRSLFRLPLE